MARRLSTAVVVAVAFLSSLASAGSNERRAGAISLAVAPFEEVHPSEGGALSIADRLARRFEARQLERVVVLSDLGIEPVERPEARDVREWAARAEVDSVVIGQVIEVGDEKASIRDLEISVEVRSGHSGAPVSRHHATVSGAADRSAALDEEIESITLDVLASLGYEAPSPSPAAVAAAPPAAEKTIFEKLGKDEPLSITSDELEVTSRGKARHLIFTRNVQVVQGDIDLQADRLEAFYPEGASQPERFEAQGNVRVVQDDRRAQCDHATYLKAESIVRCEGQAILIQGCDEVRGDAIQFDLDQEKVRVIGAASVLLQPEGHDCTGGRDE